MRALARVASAALFVSGCAVVPGGAAIPPDDYARPARPVEIDVLHGTPDQVQQICGGLAGYRGGRQILGCAIGGLMVGLSRCRILVIGPAHLPAWKYAFALKHERAHCHGWSRDHRR